MLMFLWLRCTARHSPADVIISITTEVSSSSSSSSHHHLRTETAAPRLARCCNDTNACPSYNDYRKYSLMNAYSNWSDGSMDSRSMDPDPDETPECIWSHHDIVILLFSLCYYSFFWDLGGAVIMHVSSFGELSFSSQCLQSSSWPELQFSAHDVSRSSSRSRRSSVTWGRSWPETLLSTFASSRDEICLLKTCKFLFWYSLCSQITRHMF